jgi:putative tryptophan/tyrosine transport system substrate-binding protein
LRAWGNATGVNPLLPAMEGKRLGLLREVIPKGALLAVLLNPASQDNFNRQLNDVQETAREVGQQLLVLHARTDEEIEAAFATAAERLASGVLVDADPFMLSRRERLVALASRYAVPAIYEAREYATAGGLMSYGISLANAYRQAGVYVGQILKGVKPSDLPVLQPTKFNFVINLKTAKALGLTIPDKLLAIVRQQPMQFQKARQCGARTRSGKPCRSPATKKGRCRLHGGASGSGGPSGKRNGQSGPRPRLRSGRNSAHC